MKKLIAALVLTFLMIPMAFAYAEGTGMVDTTQLTQFKDQAKVKLATIKDFKTQNEALRKSAKEKSQEIKNITKTMRQNKQTFTLEQLDAIAAKVESVKKDRQDIIGIKSFGVEHQRFRTNRMNKNFEAALQNLDNIISIQSQRNAALQKLNGDLDALLASMK